MLYKRYGATQGILLEFVLFLIYINSILKGKLFMFANDIVLVNIEDNWETLKRTEIDLQNIYDRLKNNLLPLNINK